MKHIKLFEDYVPLLQFTHPEGHFAPKFEDETFAELVELLREQGFENAYYGQKKDGTKFISGFGKDSSGMTPALFLRDNDETYHFESKDGALKASYTPASKNVQDLVKVIKMMLK